MAPLRTVEGEADFSVPAAGKPCKTWYKVYGDLSDRSVTPTVVLHGGPGFPHWYVEPIAGIAYRFSMPVVIYDQLGCGLSTHLPEKKGDTDFWTVQLFIDELHNLLRHLGIQGGYNILGHSWGGMLAASFAVQKPKGLRKLVISSSPASMALFVEGCAELRKALPPGVQDALNRHEAAGTTDSEDYKESCEAFGVRHECRIRPKPDVEEKSEESMGADPTVYLTMNGPSEFYITGSLKTFDLSSELHNIEVPTLLTNGRYDEVQDLSISPFFEQIRQVKWVQFAESAHVAHIEETERYLDVVGRFLVH
ncbi:prolyl aminopeptidase [Coniophora puteana RWD-64-598 SS2]|uniref:Prolyl aminopeptidase n=1 Tax=Coniophora puteana (strain RWD-64-598) TaxID=741705 RepID=A0A5M3MEM3_CONPW|nr:prolyl aminopeptidase [Coniophora puteana RWD-64-598 SS2]EIW77055.1 prolyl aminopeptidase [Coniophora puteana RWD-64-598 SS2]